MKVGAEHIRSRNAVVSLSSDRLKFLSIQVANAWLIILTVQAQVFAISLDVYYVAVIAESKI